MIGGFDVGTPGGPEPVRTVLFAAPPNSHNPQPPTDLPQKSEISGVWVQGGPGQKISVVVTVDARQYRLTGNFNVIAPTNAVIKLTPDNDEFDGWPDYGVTVRRDTARGAADGQMTVEFGSGPFGKGVRPGTNDVDGVGWTASEIGPTWSYAWVQTLAYYHETITSVKGNSEIPTQRGVLDVVCPAATDKPSGDSPGFALVPGQNVFYEVVATTWLMVESKTTGQWVPVASVNWDWAADAVYPDDEDSDVDVISTHKPTIVTNFTPTNVFPEWTKTVSKKLEPLPDSPPK